MVRLESSAGGQCLAHPRLLGQALKGALLEVVLDILGGLEAGSR